MLQCPFSGISAKPDVAEKDPATFPSKLDSNVNGAAHIPGGDVYLPHFRTTRCVSLTLPSQQRRRVPDTRADVAFR